MVNDKQPPVGEKGRVSIVIPAYNYESYIAYAIDSALAQTYSDVEVVVIDDGSEDGTGEIVKGYGDRVRYVRQENAGLAAARNSGIDESKGEFLIFLDADDALEPHAVATMVEASKKLADDWGLVACQYTAIDETGKVVGRQKGAPAKDVLISYENLLLRNRFCPIALVKRSVFDRCGRFDPDFGTFRMGSEDRDMWIRLAGNHQILLLAKRLVKKRDHAVNMSSQASSQMAAMRYALSKARRAGVVSKWNLPLWARVNAVYHYQGALMYKEAGAPWAAWRQLLLSIIAYPWFCDHRKVGFRDFFRPRCLLSWALGSRDSEGTKSQVFQKIKQLWELRSLPKLRIDLRHRDTLENEQFFADYTKGFYSQATKRHPKFPLVRAMSSGVAIKELESKFDDYYMSLDGSARRNDKKAKRNGYTFTRFEFNDRIDEIKAIVSSTRERQGRAMPERLLRGDISEKTNPPSRTKIHDYPFYGIESPESGSLAAYAGCFICGDVCMIETIYGHAEHQNNGVVAMLIVRIAEQLITEFPDVSYYMYGTTFGASETLQRFKRKMRFTPYRVSWQLG